MPRSLCLNICTRCGGSKASLTQLGVCPRGWRGLEGVLSNSSPSSAQNLPHILWAVFPCRARSVCGAWGVPAPLLAFPRGWTVQGGEGAACSCIWILSGIVLCGHRLHWGCAALSCPHKEVLYAAWQSPRGCGFLRKEGVLFGLQGCLSSATSQCLWLPASLAIVSLWRAGRDWHVGCFVVAVWCLWGELPPSSTPKNMDLPCWGLCGAGEGGLSKAGLSPVSPSLCGSSNHGSSPLVVTQGKPALGRLTPHITQELLVRSL